MYPNGAASEALIPLMIACLKVAYLQYRATDMAWQVWATRLLQPGVTDVDTAMLGGMPAEIVAMFLPPSTVNSEHLCQLHKGLSVAQDIHASSVAQVSTLRVIAQDLLTRMEAFEASLAVQHQMLEAFLTTVGQSTEVAVKEILEGIPDMPDIDHMVL
ncbi:hypothetical protein BC828DRAFT_409913 [Blastocladiella britannica]|nr:hypothetical protein BC828DRAFT_409913 [Blastocladiella britannica]